MKLGAQYRILVFGGSMDDIDWDTLTNLILLCEDLDENDPEMENELKKCLQTHKVHDMFAAKLSDAAFKHKLPTFSSSQSVDEKLSIIQV